MKQSNKTLLKQVFTNSVGYTAKIVFIREGCYKAEFNEWHVLDKMFKTVSGAAKYIAREGFTAQA